MEATRNKTTLASLLYEYRSMIEQADRLEERSREMRRKAAALAKDHLHQPMYDAGCVVASGDTIYTYNPENDKIEISAMAWAYEIEVDAPEDVDA